MLARRWVITYLAPYGGPSWQVSCLLPPSSISLFATILMKMEVHQTVARRKPYSS